MSYKSNIFPAAKTKKTPIKFGGFGNLLEKQIFTHSLCPRGLRADGLGAMDEQRHKLIPLNMQAVQVGMDNIKAEN